MESNITLIACIDRNNGIGKDNQLLFNLPDDMRFFRETTQDSIVIMGRTTYESIGKPLKNRINIVLSRSYTSVEKFELALAGVIVMDDLRELKTILNVYDLDKEIFIIGGQSIYEQFMDTADRLIITHVEQDKEADSFFPAITDEWMVTKETELTRAATIRYYSPV